MSPGKKVLRSSENVAKAECNQINLAQKTKKHVSALPLYHHHPGVYRYQVPHHYHQQYHQILPPPQKQPKTLPFHSLPKTQSLVSQPPSVQTHQKQPNPPRSAFICFKDSKKREIMEKCDVPENHDKVLEIVASEWKELSEKDRAYWDEEARNDKVRFVREKAAYKGTWNIPKRRAKKHPAAPKRPMSAFLKFSQSRRPQVKVDNPYMANTDVSRLLGEMWRNSSLAEKAPFVEEELKERAVYKEEVQEFREKQASLDAGTRTTNQSVVSVCQVNHPQSQKTRPQKLYRGFERQPNSSTSNISFENYIIDPLMDDLSTRPSAFHQHMSQQHIRPIYHHSEYYSRESYPQTTWSALSMDDSDPLPVLPSRVAAQHQMSSPNGDDFNTNVALYPARGSSYFADPFDLPRYPHYP